MEAKNLNNEYAHLQYIDVRAMGIGYGPLETRRFGQAIGINLLGSAQKLCSFDCAYCDLGNTQVRLNQIRRDTPFVSLEELAAKLEETFSQIFNKQIAISGILLSGNGEPTLYPHLSEAIDIITKLREQYFTSAPISILTNGALLDQRKVFEAVNKADERIVKIDVGNDKLLKKINSPLVRTSVNRLISGTTNLKDTIVQSLFIQGVLDNTQNPDIDDWIEVMGLIKPKLVQICGMNRVPATSGLTRVDEDTLYTIGSKLARKTQIKFEVFP